MTQRSQSIANGCDMFSCFRPLRLTPRSQGAFDSYKHEHLPRTKYDVTVDESSNKPGEQAFEVHSFPYIVVSLLT